MGFVTCYGRDETVHIKLDQTERITFAITTVALDKAGTQQGFQTQQQKVFLFGVTYNKRATSHPFKYIKVCLFDWMFIVR